MAKTRVGVLLRETVGGNKSSNSGSQSADLKQLTDKYGVFTKRLKSFIQALLHHKAAMEQIDKTRCLVVQHFAVLSKGSPMWEAAGLMPSADRPSSSVCSYTSVHDNLSAKTKAFVVKFQQFVIDYVIEWEKVVTTRIENGLKKTEELRRDLDHYQKKVENMRLSNAQTAAKGKNIKPEYAEKLRRNEEKLVSSKQLHNKASTDLCILMEEVVERNWRDLHPILIKCVQFDMTVSGEESKVLGNLSQVVTALKQVATQSGLSPQPRLKDLATLKPELLSTRPGGVVPQIENDTSFTPATTPSVGSATLSPMGGGGDQMGSFPVMTASAPPMSNSSNMGGSVNNNNSQFGFGSSEFGISSGGGGSNYGPSTTDFGSLSLSGNPAPAPTFEDVYSSSHMNNSINNNSYNNSNTYGSGAGAGSNAMTIHSAPNSGGINLAHLYGNTSGTPMARHSSFGGDSTGDNGSMYSGYSAPASIMPPPPPNMPPPPPPNQHMPPMPPPSYNNNDMYQSHGGGGNNNNYGNMNTSFNSGTSTPTYNNNNNGFYNYGSPAPAANMYSPATVPGSGGGNTTNPFDH